MKKQKLNNQLAGISVIEDGNVLDNNMLAQIKGGNKAAYCSCSKANSNSDGGTCSCRNGNTNSQPNETLKFA